MVSSYLVFKVIIRHHGREIIETISILDILTKGIMFKDCLALVRQTGLSGTLNGYDRSVCLASRMGQRDQSV